jgi:hypothetical protein
MKIHGGRNNRGEKRNAEYSFQQWNGLVQKPRDLMLMGKPTQSLRDAFHLSHPTRSHASLSLNMSFPPSATLHFLQLGFLPAGTLSPLPQCSCPVFSRLQILPHPPRRYRSTAADLTLSDTAVCLAVHYGDPFCFPLYFTARNLRLNYIICSEIKQQAAQNVFFHSDPNTLTSSP